MRFRSRDERSCAERLAQEQADREAVVKERREAKQKLRKQLQTLASLVDADTEESRGELRDHVDGYWHALSVGREELRLILDEGVARDEEIAEGLETKRDG